MRIKIFDQSSGLCSSLFPMPGKRNKKSGLPDFFDEVECRLNPSRSNNSSLFVTEFHKINSFRSLAANPAVFMTASEIASFYLKNGSHLLDAQVQLELLRTSLHSFARAFEPKVVLIKLYFCFAKNEGLPVKESWRDSLSANLSRFTNQALSLPVDQAEITAGQCNKILESLKNWMNAETELQV